MKRSPVRERNGAVALTQEAPSARSYLLLLLITGTALGLMWSWPAPWSHGLALLLLVVWPTWTWNRMQTGRLAERLAAAGGLILLLNSLLILLLAYMPGGLPRWLQLFVHWLVAVLPIVLGRWRAAVSEPEPGASRLAPVFITLMILVIFRLPGLGYSEFQGDEGVILSRAAGIILGDDAELFLHQKGPIEILVPLGLWNLSGTLNEASARLQFAWASGLALLAVICLADRWFRPPVGMIAGLLFAISGFATAFGRIVQYQSFVMLWGTLSLLHLSRYRDRKRIGELLLAATFLAGGLLAHYDAILIVPAAVVLWLVQMPGIDRRQWRQLAYAGLLGALILALFYVPFFLSPNFGRTGAYLVGTRLGAGAGRGLLSWSGPAVWQMLTFYNSIYYIVGMALLISVGIGSLRRQGAHLAAALSFVFPTLFYLLIVADPRTHVYTMFLGGAILAAAGLVSLGRQWPVRRSPRIYYAALGVVGLFFVISANYTYLMFVDHTPERQRTWSENRPTYYPSTWSDPPLYGLFGFPHQAGWRIVADLLPPAAYPYASNEEEEISNWYMAQAPRTHCPDFQTFILTEHTQDEIPYDRALVETLDLQYRVMIDDRLSMRILSRGPVAEVQTIEAAGAARWLAPADVAPPMITGDFPVNQTFGDDQVRLLGYDLSSKTVSPGQELVVTLYWQALAPFDRNFQTFVHLTDGENLAQHDGAPECDINPTTRWEPGQIIPDPHLLRVPAEIKESQVALIAGMYDLITLDRLPLDGASVDAYHLDGLDIREADE